MLTDDMLRQAAAESNSAFVASAEEDYHAENQYVPSLDFEKRMKKLSRRANHPYLYPAMQRIASFVLAVILATSAWLTVDVQARETFFYWVKETYETFFVYRFTDQSDEVGATEEVGVYYPNWLPEGYAELYTTETEDVVHIIYSNELGQYLKIQYTLDLQDRDWFFDATDMIKHETTVNRTPADLFLSSNTERANAVVWITEDNMAFYVSAFLDENDLIKVAENLIKK